MAASEDAYGDGITPAGLVAEKHVQDVLYLPSRTGSSDNDAIKSAIMSSGAVYTSMYADSGMCDSSDSAAYNTANGAYYYSGSSAANHAVDIVGWDDNYPASNFSSDGVTDEPPGNGAFIVRNSWGTGWGYAGYFYVSYYDSRFGYGENAVFDDAEPTTNYDAIYQYDPLGWTDSFGYGSDTAWFANDFIAAASDQLAAVSFYAAEPDASYTLYAGSSLSSLSPDGSGGLSLAGYHTVSLSAPLQLTSGQEFVVAVDLTTPGDDYPIPLETNISGYTSAATAAPGESFVSLDGGTWTDLTSIDGEQQSNVCLKAFTLASAALTPTLTSFAPTSDPVGASVTLGGSGFTDATAVSFNGTAAAFTVNSDTQITATVPSGATSGSICVTTPGGTATSATSFTVIPPSSDDTLSALTVSAGSLSPAFAAGTLSYADSVANSVESITVSPTTNDSNASYVLQVGGSPVTNPIALSVGADTIDVVVSAQDGVTSQTYSLKVTRALLTPKLTLKLSGLTSGVLKLGKRVMAKGTVRPIGLAGDKVTLVVQRKHDGTWHRVTSMARTISTKGTFSGTYRPAKRGTYRVKATIAKTSTNTAATTRWLGFQSK